jgi:Rieske Fe-S protein
VSAIDEPTREQITKAPDGTPMAQQPAWRGDFPIDWPQDAYVERRDFVKFMVLTSLAFAVGQVWIAFENWRRRREGAPEIVHVGSIDALPVGMATVFAYPTEHDPCILVRPQENVLVAYSQKCTHLSCAVIPSPADGLIRCPCHDGLFDLATGRPLAGPPRRPLARIALELRGADIYATGVHESLT